MTRIDATLVGNTMRMAFEQRGSYDGLIFHSDRGSQYTALPFRELLKNHGVRQNMSRRGRVL